MREAIASNINATIMRIYSLDTKEFDRNEGEPCESSLTGELASLAPFLWEGYPLCSWERIFDSSLGCQPSEIFSIFQNK